MSNRTSNNKARLTLLSSFKSAYNSAVEMKAGSCKCEWAFDRLRLLESGFRREKLRFPQFSRVSLTANQLKGDV